MRTYDLLRLVKNTSCFCCKFQHLQNTKCTTVSYTLSELTRKFCRDGEEPSATTTSLSIHNALIQQSLSKNRIIVIEMRDYHMKLKEDSCYVHSRDRVCFSVARKHNQSNQPLFICLLYLLT